jgi:hypothetical protein
MRSAIITIIIIAFGAVILWIASDAQIGHLAEVLPFISGRDVGLYDWAGLAVLLITAWGIARLLRRRDNDS